MPDTITVQRFDRGRLRSSVRTDEGYILAEGYIARPGVLEYQQADGSVRRELVPPQELHRTDSLATLARKPVTLEHPKEDGVPVLVNPDNVEEFEVGDVDGDIEVEKLNGFVKIRMAVRRQDGIEAIDRGIRELSPGYRVDLEEVSGEHPEFGRFDAIQRNRRYNHTAITRAARAGAEIQLRADSAMQARPFEKTNTGIYIMPDTLQELLDKTNNDSDDDRSDAETFQAAYDELKSQYDALKQKHDELQGQYDALKEQVESEDAGDDEDDRMDWFDDRLDALNVADQMGVDVDDRADVPEIKRAVVEEHLGEMRQDATDDYIAGVYDHVRQKVREDKQRDRYDAIGDTLANNRTPSPDDDSDDSDDGGGGDINLDAADTDRQFRRKFRNH